MLVDKLNLLGLNQILEEMFDEAVLESFVKLAIVKVVVPALQQVEDQLLYKDIDPADLASSHFLGVAGTVALLKRTIFFSTVFYA